eukprot:3246984-Rhodomonas_salina.2
MRAKHLCAHVVWHGWPRFVESKGSPTRCHVTHNRGIIIVSHMQPAVVVDAHEGPVAYAVGIL